VAVDGYGNAVFAWERWDGTNERIQARTLSAAGIRGSTQTLSAAGGDAIYPQVEVDPNGNAVFAWERCCYDGTNNERIQARARSAAGILSSTQTLSAVSQTASSVQLAVDPNGNAVFAWIGTDGRIQARARSAAGTLSSTQTLSDPGYGGIYPRVAVDSSDNAVFLWQRFDSTGEYRVQARARSATGILSSTQTLGGTGAAIPLGAEIVVDPHGNAVVVWEHREGTAFCCTSVEAVVRAADGTLGSTQVLSATGMNAQESHVAVDPNGHALAVWLETTNGQVHAAVGSY
jgi:hypothetical protein